MIDTHCHIQTHDYPLNINEVIESANRVDVSKLLLVGYDVDSSHRAVEVAKNRQNIWAAVGLHPHDADKIEQLESIKEYAHNLKNVAVGECGLDYYYMNSSKVDQKRALQRQFEIAKERNLPMIFHLRGKEADSSDAYDDFWEIYRSYNLPGVVHSFSAHTKQLQQILKRGLYVGANGIATFLKPGPQLEATKRIPLDYLLTETDSPFLAPIPFRGKTNQPKYLVEIAKYLSQLFNVSVQTVADKTEANAIRLFNL